MRILLRLISGMLPCSCDRGRGRRRPLEVVPWLCPTVCNRNPLEVEVAEDVEEDKLVEVDKEQAKKEGEEEEVQVEKGLQLKG